MKFYGPIALASALMLSGCAGQAPLAGTGAAPPPAAAFSLSPGDKVKIATYGEETLTGDFEVSPAGTIAFPLIGDIQAAGLQTAELSKAIEARLLDGYLLDPKVSVEVANFRPIYILGEVNKPGEYPYTQGLTIRGAVAKADGFTYRANEKRVFLKRAGEAGEQAYPLTADFPVLPGDTIRFGERYF
ncbi:MAG: polysaccharide biosynthesis protein [Sphingopyxis macrogoltabida]|uniref:Polysaccharide biosynthesis protein n=1 Tax=Sphingopyxis macrogoltabida TaxID=33050 RepID=A0A2W5L272_SPHMC|nr:MAG: polysaccharide biosynthesis protein [Sphingopyxis macrogoltabida]